MSSWRGKPLPARARRMSLAGCVSAVPSDDLRRQKSMVVQLPTEALHERLINERLTDANADGWFVVQMMDHNGLLVMLMERAVREDTDE